MEGKDLFEYMTSREFQVGENRIKEIAKGIAEALKYLHKYGIMHRDIKLENIMMSDNTETALVKVADFGLAKMIGSKEKTDEPYGTLGYAAPEVLLKDPYSFSCDLWSLGCVIYALFSGSLPFDDDSGEEVIRMTLNDPVRFNHSCWKNASAEVINLIKGLLNKN